MEQRIQTNNLLSSQMPIDDLIVQFAELAIIAVQTFNPWLIADSLYPFVVAGHRVAASSLLILPTVGKNIGATTKQVSENCYLLF